MACCISFGKIKLKYFLMLSFALGFLFLGKKCYPLYLDRKKEILSQYLSPEEKAAKKISNENRLIKTFVKYIGFSLFFILDKIRDKISFKGVKRDCFLSPLIGNEYGENGSPTNIFTYKDRIYFILFAFAFLLNEIVSIYIKILQNYKNRIPVDEGYISIIFITFYCTSYFIFKKRYYKHEYVSIIIIIFLEITRYILKFDLERKYIVKFIIVNILQIIRAFCDAIGICYANVLMDYHFFSPYKSLYIIGFINSIIIIIIYIIVTYIPVKETSKFCSLKYEGKCYFDNLYSLFKGFDFIQFGGLFLNMIGVCFNQLLYNIIANNFTICHIFPYYQIYVLYENISIFDKDESKLHILISSIISGLFEFLITLIFLEIIILNCLSFDQNIKKNIQERSLSETSDYVDENSLKIEIGDYHYEVDE